MFLESSPEYYGERLILGIEALQTHIGLWVYQAPLRKVSVTSGDINLTVDIAIIRNLTSNDYAKSLFESSHDFRKC